MRRMTPAVTTEQLHQLLDLSRKLAVTIDLESLFPQLAEITCKLVGCARASVFFFDPATNELWTQVAIGSPTIRLPRGKGLAGHVFETGQSLLTPDAYADLRFNHETDAVTGFRTRDILTVPMLDLEERPVGVIQALNCHDCFSQTHLELLELVASQAGVAVQRHGLHVQVVAAAQMRKEMELAAAVQMELLPKEVPQSDAIDVAGWSVPASITGGDCYDLWTLDDGRLAMLVADAAGHGMAPAMVVAQVRSLVRALAEPSLRPADVLNRVNARLAQDLSPQRFVTAALAYLDQDGTIDLASAGHGPLLFSPAEGEPLHELIGTGLPLVIDPEPSVQSIDPLHLQVGGQLVLLSDGIFEAPSQNGEIIGIERIHAALGTQCGATSNQKITHLRDTVYAWSGGQDIKDDQTIVIARRVK
ncbi:MAG: SpoIIE family protein phosphatase [Burkholderiales bacterium]|nr:SpoIIE family protein phosphatase [Phycisphaerae bacterium]